MVGQSIIQSQGRKVTTSSIQPQILCKECRFFLDGRRCRPIYQCLSYPLDRFPRLRLLLSEPTAFGGTCDFAYERVFIEICLSGSASNRSIGRRDILSRLRSVPILGHEPLGPHDRHLAIVMFAPIAC